VIVWLWSAGSAQGVTDDQGTALTAAALSMERAGADAAVVEQAHFVTATGTLAAGYQKADAPRWVARRRPGGRVAWALRPPAPEQAAA
jgi:hypothetical protein